MINENSKTVNWPTPIPTNWPTPIPAPSPGIDARLIRESKNKVMKRAREVFGENFENFYVMPFTDNRDGTKQIVQAKGIKIANRAADGVVVSMFRCNSVCRSEEGEDVLVFCPRGLFFHKNIFHSDVWDSHALPTLPSLYDVKEASESYFVEFEVSLMDAFGWYAARLEK